MGHENTSIKHFVDGTFSNSVLDTNELFEEISCCFNYEQNKQTL